MEESPAGVTARADDEVQRVPTLRTLDTIVRRSSLKKNPTETSFVDVPPDGGYGWVCVACCSTVNAMTWGVNSVRNSVLWSCGWIGRIRVDIFLDSLTGSF